MVTYATEPTGVGRCIAHPGSRYATLGSAVTEKRAASVCLAVDTDEMRLHLSASMIRAESSNEAITEQ